MVSNPPVSKPDMKIIEEINENEDWVPKEEKSVIMDSNAENATLHPTNINVANEDTITHSPEDLPLPPPPPPPTDHQDFVEL